MTPPPTARRRLGQPFWLVVAAVAGAASDRLPTAAHAAALAAAKVVLALFMNMLSLVSLPIIFLALSTTLAGMDSVAQLKQMGRRVVALTLLTTVLAASVALGLFVAIAPAGNAPPTAAPRQSRQRRLLVASGQPGAAQHLSAVHRRQRHVGAYLGGGLWPRFATGARPQTGPPTGQRLPWRGWDGAWLPGRSAS